MAEITGTTGADIINGTQDNGDTILALAGDDLVNSSGGSDTIDGGEGFDTLSYDNSNLFGGSGAAQFEFLSISLVTFFPLSGLVRKTSSLLPPLFLSSGTNFDSVQNFEKIVGKGGDSDINLSSASSGDVSALIDLSNNQLTLTQATGIQTFNIEKFNVATGTSNQDKFVGNDANNLFNGEGGDDLFVASGGGDRFSGGTGTDTADYSALGQAITIYAITPLGIPRLDNVFRVDTENSTDLLGVDVETVVAPVGKANALVYEGFLGAGFDVDLSQDKVNQYTIRNLVNVTGDDRDDKITGNAVNNVLKGGSGKDILAGGDGDDMLEGGDDADTVGGGNGRDSLSGTDAQARGVGELDSLTGGSGRDTFVLGDSSGSFYQGGGSNDFATITDFNFGDRFQFGENETYSIQVIDGTINLFTNTNGTPDQVAAIQLSGTFQSSAGSSSTALQGTTFGASDALTQNIFGGVTEPGTAQLAEM